MAANNGNAVPKQHWMVRKLLLASVLGMADMHPVGFDESEGGSE